MGLFGTSGIRAIVDSWLIQLALKVGLAVGQLNDNVVVGCDTRTSSGAIKQAVISGLLAAGARSFDTGVLPTPTLALAAREFDAGVMITASHNPPEYNGIKLLNPDGSAFDSHQQKQIEEMILSDSLPVVSWDRFQSGGIYHDAVDRHIEHILADFPGKFKLKVALDCGCGAASLITPELLRRMGCEVVALNCYPSGFFPRAVEPTEAVVTTIDASTAIDEAGFTVIRTGVGDNHVSQGLKKGGDFGGEPSGSWIFPRKSLCPDGIYAAAQVVSIASRQKLSHLARAIPSYPLLRGSLGSNGVLMPELERKLVAAMKPLSVSKVDGIKLNLDGGWLLIRASGTEPKIRVTAEAKTESQVHRLYDNVIRLIKDSVAGSKEN